MSNVSMTNLVSTIRGFENLGDAPIVTVPFGRHEISVDKSSGAKAEAAVLRNVIDLVRKTEGLGEKSAGFVESCFGNITAGGAPIRGREVAAVLNAAVHVLQMEISFPIGEKTLEEFAAYLQSAPLHELKESNLPQNLVALNPQQAVDFVEQHVVKVEAPPMPPPTDTRATLDVREAVEALQGFKSALGGSIRYGNQRPTYEASARTFFGLPREACQDWCQKTIDQKWIPQFFWKAVGRAFGLTDTPPTKYEKVSLYLESIRLMAENRDSLAQGFRDDLRSGQFTFATVTRLACHPENQPSEDRAGGMIRAIDNYLELFSAYFQDAKAKGTLEQFFSEALHGVCMEDRIRNLQEYAVSHPLGEGGVALPTYIPDHQATDSVIDALTKEIGVVSEAVGGADNLTWENISEHLIKTMVGMERVGDGGARVTITEEMIVSQREALNDIFIFD